MTVLDAFKLVVHQSGFEGLQNPEKIDLWGFDRFTTYKNLRGRLLYGQAAIVTGGGAGIGRGIAELFARAGAAIVISDLKKETAATVADAINANGDQAIVSLLNFLNDRMVVSASDCSFSGDGRLDCYT